MNLIPEGVTQISVSTAAAITALDFPGCMGVWISPTNGLVYLGGSDVSSTKGIPINSGERAFVPTKHPSKWYLVASSGTVTVNALFTKGHA